MIYEVIEDETNKVIKATSEDGKVIFIPFDPANSDYQRYLRWLNGEDESAELP